MATKGYVGINGVARSLKQICVGVNGVARKVKKAYIGVNGVARLCYSGVNGAVISDGEIGRNISNGYVYNGYMWVYSFYTKTLYGVSLSGGTTKAIPVSSESAAFSAMVSPATRHIALSIIDGVLFLSQVRGTSTEVTDSSFTLLQASFTGEEQSLTLTNALSSYYGLSIIGTSDTVLPYVQKISSAGTVKYYMAYSDSTKPKILSWLPGGTSASSGDIVPSTSGYYVVSGALRCFNKKNSFEIVYIEASSSSSGYSIYGRSFPNGLYRLGSTRYSTVPTVNTNEAIIASSDKFYLGGAASGTVMICDSNTAIRSLNLAGAVSIPDSAVSFADAAVFCQDVGLWFMFVGTGLVYTSDLADATKYGYMDTTSILGRITQFGYMEYQEDTIQLIVVGQDSNARVKVAAFDATSF